MHAPLQRATHTGVGGYGHTPFDARTAHGYGRLGPPSFRGGDTQSQSLYPYAQRSSMLRDLYPELFGGERQEGDEEAYDAISPDDTAEFAAKMNTQHADVDHHSVRMNKRDKSSFVGPRLSLAWHQRMGITLAEAFYNPSARDNPNSPRLPGTKHGFSSPPVDGEQWVDDDPAWTLEDIAVAAEENDELEKFCCKH